MWEISLISDLGDIKGLKTAVFVVVLILLLDGAVVAFASRPCSRTTLLLQLQLAFVHNGQVVHFARTSPVVVTGLYFALLGPSQGQTGFISGNFVELTFK